MKIVVDEIPFFSGEEWCFLSAGFVRGSKENKNKKRGTLKYITNKLGLSCAKLRRSYG
jgi:hypothetical protein